MKLEFAKADIDVMRFIATSCERGSENVVEGFFPQTIANSIERDISWVLFCLANGLFFVYSFQYIGKREPRFHSYKYDMKCKFKIADGKGQFVDSILAEAEKRGW